MKHHFVQLQVPSKLNVKNKDKHLEIIKHSQ